MLTAISGGIARFRGLFLPLGLFALLAVGIHSGSDRLDDLTLVALNFGDRLLDQLLALVIEPVWRFFGASDRVTQAAVFLAVDFIDLAVKDQIARWAALGTELLAYLVLAFPVVRHRQGQRSVLVAIKKTVRDPTVLRVAAPLASVAGCLSGVVIVTRELQVGIHTHLLSVEAAASFAGWVASAVGVVGLVLVVWRLAWVIALGAFRWADKKAVADEQRGVSGPRRRLRGWFTGVVALPISLFALLEAVQAIGTFRSLIPG